MEISLEGEENRKTSLAHLYPVALLMEAIQEKWSRRWEKKRVLGSERSMEQKEETKKIKDGTNNGQEEQISLTQKRGERGGWRNIKKEQTQRENRERGTEKKRGKGRGKSSRIWEERISNRPWNERTAGGPLMVELPSVLGISRLLLSPPSHAILNISLYTYSALIYWSSKLLMKTEVILWWSAHSVHSVVYVIRPQILGTNRNSHGWAVVEGQCSELLRGDNGCVSGLSTKIEGSIQGQKRQRSRSVWAYPKWGILTEKILTMNITITVFLNSCVDKFRLSP